MSKLIIFKSRLFNNLNLLKNNINANISAVIKDNAYGHGIIEIAELLNEYGIDSVFVKSNFEAHAIKDRFKSITILYPQSFENLAPNMNLAVISLDSINKIAPRTNIELKINTGMNRNGIELSDLDSALNLIKSRGLNLFGVFSHNGYGDTETADFLAQQEKFAIAKARCLEFVFKNNLPRPRFHSLSSSGALKASRNNIPCDDLVRIGIAMYGYLSSDLNLKPIAELWADRISSRFLNKGAKVGYEGKGVIEKDCIVSSYDIGYGDGFFRINESCDLKTKEGFRILPRMSMDCVSIESSEESVCLMHDANIIARAFNTIPYEVLCKISPQIKRIVKE